MAARALPLANIVNKKRRVSSDLPHVSGSKKRKYTWKTAKSPTDACTPDATVRDEECAPSTSSDRLQPTSSCSSDDGEAEAEVVYFKASASQFHVAGTCYGRAQRDSEGNFVYR